MTGDRVAEAHETFVLNLTGATGATVVDGQAAGTILDDEPRVRINDVSAAEGDVGQTPFAFAVTLSAAYDAPVTADWATAGGTATAGTDYQAAGGTLTFAAGEGSKPVGVAVLGDPLLEADEAFTVRRGNPGGAVVADDTGVGTIGNDDTPRTRVSDVTRSEGRNGFTLFVFTVTLSIPWAVPVTVRYATADGAARAGEDYGAASGTLTFAPGETTKTVTVKVKGDRAREADETFTLNLGGATNAEILDGTGLGTILNDD